MALRGAAWPASRLRAKAHSSGVTGALEKMLQYMRRVDLPNVSATLYSVLITFFSLPEEEPDRETGARA